MEWDKEGLKNEVNNYDNGTIINWSELALHYQIRNTKQELALNGGQIAQEWLKSEGVDINQFKKRRMENDGCRIRKRMKRGAGGEITIPCPETNSSMKVKLKEKILTGEFNVGELIVPRKYDKLVFDGGSIVKTHFFVEGRKRPLIEIRQKKLQELEKFMRVTPDSNFANMSHQEVSERLEMLNEVKEGESLEDMREKLKVMERTRHLLVWHDLSTVANHTHLVFMVTCLYDPATFYTDSEYEQITGRKVNIQSEVEAPDLYIVARSSSSDEEQLCYVETRVECLEELSDPVTTKSGIQLDDKMRFFHGDSPARQYECGQQKGGNYYCSVCGASAQRVYDLDYAFRCPYISLADRQKLVLKGPCGKRNSLAKSNKHFHGLKKDDLTRELSARGIYEGDKKKELQDLLKDELHGVQRVPALLFNSPDKTLESINCGSYEILGFEPLHDIGKHIENVLTELPEHLLTKEASELKDMLELCIGRKETKRTFDYRCALVLVSNQVRGKINPKAQLLLDTLVEIQEIAYSSEVHRTPRSVLRLHNLTWRHAMLCRKVIGFTLKHLTTRKFYGNYFHNITTHAPIQNRLISGRSANAEEQERVFNAITNITRTTSSYHSEHIIGNIFLRLQAEKNLKTHQTSTSVKQEAHLSKLASSLPKFGNTIIQRQMLDNCSSVWQAHLERISDFLLAGEGVWWKACENGDIEFFDAKGNPETVPDGPALHHFRSSNFKSEEAYLKECWKICLQNKSQIPVIKLRIEDENGNMVLENLTLPNNEASTNQDGEIDAGNEGQQVVRLDVNGEMVVGSNVNDLQGEKLCTVAENEDEISFGGFSGDQVVGVGNDQGLDKDGEHKSQKVGKGVAGKVYSNEKEIHVDRNDGNNEHIIYFQESSSEITAANWNIDGDTSNPSTCNLEPVSSITQSDKLQGAATQTKTCETKQGSALEFILGPTKEVLQFEKARKRVKASPGNDNYFKDYQDILAVMETTISREQRNIKERLMTWEHEYFEEHSRLPTSKDMLSSPTAKLMIDQLKFYKALVRQWKK